MAYPITLKPVRREEQATFCKNLQNAFAVAVIETFGTWEGGPIPETKTVMDSFELMGRSACTSIRNFRWDEKSSYYRRVQHLDYCLLLCYTEKNIPFRKEAFS